MLNQLERVADLVSRMVTLEQAACPEWNEIEVFAEEALMLITSHQIGDRIDPYVIKFLDDVEIRRTEKTFGEHQRKMVMRAIQPLKT